MSGRRWNVPIGTEHPDHLGWVRVDRGAFRIAFERDGVEVESDLFAMLSTPDPEAEVASLIELGEAKLAHDWGRRVAYARIGVAIDLIAVQTDPAYLRAADSAIYEAGPGTSAPTYAALQDRIRRRLQALEVS